MESDPRGGTPAPPLHGARRMAESFGTDPGGYDRARPGYPAELVGRVLAGVPGHDVLDVGCGTGIAGRQFQAAGCTVLGVEPDPRMAAHARGRGLPVEVATFEQWDPAGRIFDAVIAAQSWHWVDPALGVPKAAGLLRPGGRFAVFGHAYEPPLAVAEPLAAALARAVPDSPFAGMPARRPPEAYQQQYAAIAETLGRTPGFVEPGHWRFDWERGYTREEWLALLPTTGGLTRLRPDQLAEVLAAAGAAIDALGGSFTMDYTTWAATAVRDGTGNG